MARLIHSLLMHISRNTEWVCPMGNRRYRGAIAVSPERCPKPASLTHSEGKASTRIEGPA